jgi:hypothetical protein
MCAIIKDHKDSSHIVHKGMMQATRLTKYKLNKIQSRSKQQDPNKRYQLTKAMKV